MAEVDYQLALLLQHKFEQEAKKPKEFQSDIEIAKALQEQFQSENEIEIPKNGLVYKTKKSSLNSSKCLVDPSWEVIDPTPDIHVLFISFNDRFFWGTLVAVCVSWSKRMTTCAGICSYQGRGGLCSITLSEPLLKLRPRKDLVETLLHEMIHAYLFVTNNNRDRDGHGPEFHKHMFRINKEAGTNITVYHDFHDEVRLYKQHWWRCDGPCQKRRPYFGMVRRVTNRAPGPNDRWWGEHSRSCGGTFIKVKEPEKPPKKAPAKENIKPKEDIRKYIPVMKKGATDVAAETPTKHVKDTTTPSTSKSVTRNPLNNIHTINNNSDKKINNVIPKANNIFGFTNLSGSASSFKGKGGGTALKNNSNTIVINKKSSTGVKTGTTTNISSTVTSQTLKGSSVSNDNSDYSVVRNHWLNKFSNGTSSGVKRSGSLDSLPNLQKIPKVDLTQSVEELKNESSADCPVCLEQVSLASFNEHLDKCLLEPKKKECIICGGAILAAEYELHVTKCSEENFDNVFAEPTDSNLKKCTVCEKMFHKTEFDAHVEKCLLKFYDDMEEAYTDKDERVDCLTCNKSVVKSELSAHLDECMGLSRVFEDDNPVMDIESANSCDSDKESKFNCPFCMELVVEEEMKAHIDLCLNTVGSSSESEINKSAIISSIVDDDF